MPISTSALGRAKELGLRNDPRFKKMVVAADGTVERIIVLPQGWTGSRPGDWQCPDGCTLVDPPAGMKGVEEGGNWDGTTFTRKPAPEVKKSATQKILDTLETKGIITAQEKQTILDGG